jgi:hypothetical protein
LNLSYFDGFAGETKDCQARDPNPGEELNRCCRRNSGLRLSYFCSNLELSILGEAYAGAPNPYYLLAFLTLRLRASQDGRF